MMFIQRDFDALQTFKNQQVSSFKSIMFSLQDLMCQH